MAVETEFELTFDHVALGVRDATEPLSRIISELGGRLFSGGSPTGSGFRALQLHLGNGVSGMSVELLEPADVDSNDFLERFVTANGDGPHHVTFKTNDIAAELERLRSRGIEPVAITFTDPFWREMFIHPRDSHGPVIQIAETDAVYPSMSDWIDGLPETLEVYHGDAWWGDEIMVPDVPRYELKRVVVETSDRVAGDEFYTRILGSIFDPHEGWSDHSWPGGSIRLVDSEVSRPRVGWLEVTAADLDVVIGGARFRSESG